jgi:hypothetical protein
MPSAAPIAILNFFQQQLIGNWANADFGKDSRGNPVGGPANPLSYNIMPLPQKNDLDGVPNPNGYILKNFRYHERLHFNDDNAAVTLAISARAPNRGGEVNQDARVIFYEQQVKFAEGPQGPRTVSRDGDVVHVENGAWLWLPRYQQSPGPYTENPPGSGQFPPPPASALVPPSVQQPTDVLIAKQISVPHGNSILAMGSFDTIPNASGQGGPWKGVEQIPGSPIIPDGLSPFPTAYNFDAPIPPSTSILNADTVYGTATATPTNYQNPHPDLTLNPNLPLQQAVAIIKPDSFVHWRVTTAPLQNGTGAVTNIPFEQRVSEVTEYAAEYWLLMKGSQKYLAYTQTILLVMVINDKKFVFPHLTCNTVTFQP